MSQVVETTGVASSPSVPPSPPGTSYGFPQARYRAGPPFDIILLGAPGP